MTATFMRRPKFRNAQWVSFVGGEGIVRSYTPEYGRWMYLIEMALGLEPDFGRVGAETMILLTEADLLTTYSEFQAGCCKQSKSQTPAERLFYFC
ncbi:MAG: hypothetical protein V7K77_12305 [Nostoc sp.]|uniref:hypothetical protein n=1 Tax=Nostoc sp. TaxID=1180 RepID=UPI002FF7F79B